MSKRMIIAEKPSVAADFAKALGATRKEGYFESEDHLVTFCVGHLLELYMPDDYGEDWVDWKLETLPLIPDRFRYKPVSRTVKQLQAIKSLIKDKSPSEIVVATDAGREGELIARLVLEHCGVNGNVELKRFWSSEALSEDAVKRGLESLKPLSEYDRLYKQGKSRQLTDWVVGMNFSRALAVGLKSRLSFGRVQSAVLGIICDREQTIETFKPEPYYRLRIDMGRNGEGFFGFYIVDGKSSFPSKEIKLPLVMEQIKQAGTGLVDKCYKSEKKENPPLLFSLTELQKEANRRLGWSADKTLKVAQALYEEKKVLTYPRTPSKHLSETDQATFEAAVQAVSMDHPDLFAGSNEIEATNKRIFDATKVEDHHALFVQDSLEGKECTADEKSLYEIVLLRMACVLRNPYVYESISAEIQFGSDAGKHTVRARGRKVIDIGWKALVQKTDDEKDDDNADSDDATLPDLNEGDEVSYKDGKITEHETKPPKRFTEATILSAMDRPGAFATDDEIKCVGLGTPATRAAIIETLISRDLVGRKGKNLVPLANGTRLWEFIKTQNYLHSMCKVEETARWEEMLQKEPDRFYDSMKKYVEEAIGKLKKIDWSAYEAKRPTIGICPKCGGDIFETKKGYGCSNWKEKGCDFVIWKTIASGTVDTDTAKILLSGGESKPLSCKKKNGEKFKAKIKLDGDHKVVFVRD